MKFFKNSQLKISTQTQNRDVLAIFSWAAYFKGHRKRDGENNF